MNGWIEVDWAVHDEPLAQHTTFRIGGAAEYFLRAHSRDELIADVCEGWKRNLRVFVLGNGSNILVADRGIRGLVVENLARGTWERTVERGTRERREPRASDAVGASPEKGENHDPKIEKRDPKSKQRDMQIESREEKGARLLVTAESGVLMPGLANRLARSGWSGLEWAIGVPSTVGAAIVGNAGAHGASIADNLVRAELMDRRGEIRWWTVPELEFDYRTSYLKKHPGEFVVLSSEFQLIAADGDACIARMNQYTEHRRRTQPTEPSVGSMFKNPPGDFAGRLIEAAGLKGTRIGQVEVSRVHANFFVNRGGATASEVLKLIELVRERVQQVTGVDLELEIQLVGEFDRSGG